MDSNATRSERPFSEDAGVLFNFFVRSASAARSELSQATSLARQPFADTVVVTGETFTVAFVSNNRAVAEEATAFATESMAREYMNRRLAADRSLADSLHVIPTVERAA